MRRNVVNRSKVTHSSTFLPLLFLDRVLCVRVVREHNFCAILPIYVLSQKCEGIHFFIDSNSSRNPCSFFHDDERNMRHTRKRNHRDASSYREPKNINEYNIIKM